MQKLHVGILLLHAVCIYYWRSESICGPEMAAWREMSPFTGDLGGGKDDCCSLTFSPLAGLSRARAPLVKTLFEGKGR